MEFVAGGLEGGAGGGFEGDEGGGEFAVEGYGAAAEADDGVDVFEIAASEARTVEDEGVGGRKA